LYLIVEEVRASSSPTLQSKPFSTVILDAPGLTEAANLEILLLGAPYTEILPVFARILLPASIALS